MTFFQKWRHKIASDFFGLIRFYFDESDKRAGIFRLKTVL